jgi:hypothetical protein
MTSHPKLTLLALFLGLWLWLTPLPIKAQSTPYETATPTDILVNYCDDADYAAAHCSCTPGACGGVPENCVPLTAACLDMCPTVTSPGVGEVVEEPLRLPPRPPLHPPILLLTHLPVHLPPHLLVHLPLHLTQALKSWAPSNLISMLF